MTMADNYFDYLYRVNGKDGKHVADEKPQIETVAQDEAIGKPWTHRLTIYCSNPSKEFIDGLKQNECVVAVYEKAKDATEVPAEKTETKSDDAPSNK